MIFPFACAADDGYLPFSLRFQKADGFGLVVRFLFGNAVKQMPVLLTVLLTDGVAVTYNKIGGMSVPDVFVCAAIATDYVRRICQYLQRQGSGRIFPVC